MEGSTSLLDALADRVERKVEDESLQRDTQFLESLLPLMEIFSSYFDGEVRGWERLPAEGPMLIIGNHSGGTIVPDTSVFISSWYRERGMESTLLGLAFDAMFAVPGVETLMRKLGEIPANHANAAEALATGASLLIYPGGAHEAFRPWKDRNRIDFGGHKGFVKLALREGVPVVPLVGHGGHETTVVLTRGDAIGRISGLERLRLRIAPILWQVPWGVSLPLLPGVPLPAKITMELGEPIDWSHLGPEAADDPKVVDRCYAETIEAMQASLSRLADENPYPVLSRLRSLLPF
jgi:1-acyl-sn-glycerol-3-phosphate acyltransferase